MCGQHPQGDCKESIRSLVQSANITASITFKFMYCGGRVSHPHFGTKGDPWAASTGESRKGLVSREALRINMNAVTVG